MILNPSHKRKTLPSIYSPPLTSMVVIQFSTSDFSSLYVPTEAEIKDRGKSDWLAKSLVLVQTS